jgi:hypothetical protein
MTTNNIGSAMFDFEETAKQAQNTGYHGVDMINHLINKLHTGVIVSTRHAR